MSVFRPEAPFGPTIDKTQPPRRGNTYRTVKCGIVTQ